MHNFQLMADWQEKSGLISHNLIANHSALAGYQLEKNVEQKQKSVQYHVRLAEPGAWQ